MARIKEYFLENLRIKLVSIVMAVIIWLAITSIGEERKSLYSPIVVSGLKGNYTLVRVDPEGVFVTLRGPIVSLRNVTERDLRVNISAFYLTPGYHSYNVEKKDIIVPRGLKVEEVHPHSVMIEVDRLTKRKVKVIPKISEDIEKGYVIYDYSPKYVEIEGAERVLSLMGSLEVVIEREKLDKSGEEIQVPLKLHNPGIKSVLPEHITVKIGRRGQR